MKVFCLVAVFLCCCATYAQAKSTEPYDYKPESSVKVTNREDQLQDLLPKRLLRGLLQQQNPHELQARILNSAQIVQHPQGAQSFYLPPNLRSDNLQNAPSQQPEEIQLQVPTDSEAKKIVLHLPPQQYPVHPQFQYQTPPRKHYKIILVRSPPAPTSPPAPVLPEIEEKTLIYVLVKKADQPTVEQMQEIQQAQNEAIKLNKPEVYFIKYKANENQQGSNISTPKEGQVTTLENPSGNQHSSIGDIIQRQTQQGHGGFSGYST